MYQIGDMVLIQFNWYESGTPMDDIPMYTGMIIDVKEGNKLNTARGSLFSDGEHNFHSYTVYCFYVSYGDKRKSKVYKYMPEIRDYEIKELLSR